MGNGNKDESHATVTCYTFDDMECEPGEIKTFRIEYKMNCWGLWDWAECKAIVNGVTKYKETNGNVEGFWTFEIECNPGATIEWYIKCRLTDIGWEKLDECTGSINLIGIEDLDCTGNIAGNVRSGERVTGSFTVKNIGGTGSKLDWKVDSYPDWGSSWDFYPSSGHDLAPGAGKTVTVSFNAPDERDTYSGSIKVVNLQDSSDYDTVSVSITVPRARQFVNPVILRFLKAFSLLEILQRLLFDWSPITEPYEI